VTTVTGLEIRPVEEGIVRMKWSTASCAGVGWERLERRVPNTIGGRSERWRSSVGNSDLGEDSTDEDAVIVRGRD
jgi:hypothetical protein